MKNRKLIEGWSAVLNQLNIRIYKNKEAAKGLHEMKNRKLIDIRSAVLNQLNIRK